MFLIATMYPQSHVLNLLVVEELQFCSQILGLNIGYLLFEEDIEHSGLTVKHHKSGSQNSHSLEDRPLTVQDKLIIFRDALVYFLFCQGIRSRSSHRQICNAPVIPIGAQAVLSRVLFRRF
jgi:hypothetical protein